MLRCDLQVSLCWQPLNIDQRAFNLLQKVWSVMSPCGPVSDICFRNGDAHYAYTKVPTHRLRCLGASESWLPVTQISSAQWCKRSVLSSLEWRVRHRKGPFACMTALTVLSTLARHHPHCPAPSPPLPPPAPPPPAPNRMGEICMLHA